MSGARAIGTRVRLRNQIAKASPARQGATVDAVVVNRTQDELADRVNQLIASTELTVVDVDLVVGANTVAHTLGRAPTVVHVTPLDADGSFAWGWDPVQTGNQAPTRQTVINVAGAPMRARIEVR